MKITIIGPAYPYRGGIAAYNERLASQFQKEGHEVSIVTFKRQYPELLFPGKTQYVSEDTSAPSDLKITRSIDSVNPLNWVKVGNQIAAEKPDLVIARYWLPLMGPALGTILRRIRKRCDAKIIALVDNMIPHETRPGDRAFTKYFIGPVDAYLAMTESVKRDIQSFDDSKPVIVSPHPIYDSYGEKIEREEALNRLGLSTDFKYLLFFGFVRKYKGLDLLIEAFGDPRFRERNIRLIVAGEYYTDKQYYMDLIQSLDLSDRVTVIDDYIPDHEVSLYFSAADLVVQPYRSATQSGVTQIAYHFEVPMVVTDVGGLAEMCPDGIVGYVTDTNPSSIADAILKYFDNNDQPQMQRNIAVEKSKYSWDVLSQNILNLYYQLTQS